MSSSKLNDIFRSMKARCYNPNRKDFKHYGAKGVTVCFEWLNAETIHYCKGSSSKGWKAFKEWALSHGYKEGLTLDRIDVNKGYSPDNCRWVSMKVQNNNRGNNHLITYKGQTKTLQQWADELKLHKNTLKGRLNRGWSIEKAFTSTSSRMP